MLVKSVRENDHLSDLQETFDTLRSYNMKLNPSKCEFEVTAGKFLGFMVSQRGIEVNPKKVRAIMELEPPKTVKTVQSLNGKVAALNRFVSKATDKCLPFFSSTEEIIRVDGRMPESIRGLEEVPIVPTTSQPVRARRRAVPLHCGLVSSS